MKSIGEGSIELRGELYTLKATENKVVRLRESILIKKLFIDTQPFTIEGSKTLK